MRAGRPGTTGGAELATEAGDGLVEGRRDWPGERAFPASLAQRDQDLLDAAGAIRLSHVLELGRRRDP